MLFQILNKNYQFMTINYFTFDILVILQTFKYLCDVPPSSLTDSNVSLKLKQRKSKELSARSLIRSTLGVEGRAGAPGWD
jgi:hypothetical protein